MEFMHQYPFVCIGGSPGLHRISICNDRRRTSRFVIVCIGTYRASCHITSMPQFLLQTLCLDESNFLSGWSTFLSFQSD